MKTVISVLVAIVCIAATSDALAQSDRSQPTHEENIRELLRLTGSGKLGMQTMQQMLVSMKQAMPQVPEQFWEDFMAKAQPDQIIEKIVPIYVKHFTPAEVQAMLALYRSKEGQGIIEKLPIVAQESILAGQEWGKQLAAEVVRELRAKGYEPR